MTTQPGPYGTICELGHPVRPDGSHLNQQDYFTHPAASEAAAIARRAQSPAQPPSASPPAPGPTSSGRRRGQPLAPWQRYQLARELALPDHPTNVALARKYGVSNQAISAFRRDNRDLIEHIAANMEDPFAGLWIADKANRVGLYERAAEEAAVSGDRASLVQIQKAVAEELGQLPPRLTLSVTPVVHQYIGVSPDDLK